MERSTLLLYSSLLKSDSKLPRHKLYKVVWHWLLGKDVLLVQGPCMEEWPWEVSQLKGRSLPYSQAASEGGWGSKSTHCGCCIHGKWLALSQIAYNGKGVLETPCNQNFLCLFYKWILQKPHAIHVLIAWSCSELICVDAHIVAAHLWVFSEQIESRGVLGLPMAQAFTFFGASNKVTHLVKRSSESVTDL